MKIINQKLTPLIAVALSIILFIISTVLIFPSIQKSYADPINSDNDTSSEDVTINSYVDGIIGIDIEPKEPDYPVIFIEPLSVRYQSLPGNRIQTFQDSEVSVYSGGTSLESAVYLSLADANNPNLECIKFCSVISNNETPTDGMQTNLTDNQVEELDSQTTPIKPLTSETDEIPSGSWGLRIGDNTQFQSISQNPNGTQIIMGTQNTTSVEFSSVIGEETRPGVYQGKVIWTAIVKI